MTYIKKKIMDAPDPETNLQPITDRDVYIPVSVEDELPTISTFYLCLVSPNKWNTNNEAECFFDTLTRKWSISPNARFIKVTHWLKKVSLLSLLNGGKDYEAIDNALSKVPCDAPFDSSNSNHQ